MGGILCAYFFRCRKRKFALDEINGGISAPICKTGTAWCDIRYKILQSGSDGTDDTERTGKCTDLECKTHCSGMEQRGLCRCVQH